MNIKTKRTRKTQRNASAPSSSVAKVNGLSREDASLSGYIRDIGPHATLNAEEEAEQAKTIFELEQKLWAEIVADTTLSPLILRALARERDGQNDPDAAPAVTDLLDRMNGDQKAADRAALIRQISDELRALDEDRSMASFVLQHIGSGLGGRDGKVSDETRRRIRGIAEQVTVAKHRFIKENLGLVINIARRYRVDQMSLSDLIQEGNIGLIRAVDKFDHRKGFRFSTYASWWIRSYISRAIVRKSSTVRIPEYMLRDRNRIKRTEEAHRVREGFSLSEDELAKELGLSPKRLNRTLRHDVVFVESLDREMPGNENQKYIDFLADEEAKSPLDMASFNDWLRSIPRTLSHLSVVERFVICWRFGLIDGDEMTLQEIGQHLSLSRERIRQIQEEALEKLRDHMEVTAA